MTPTPTPTARWRLIALLAAGGTLVAAAVAPKAMLTMHLAYFLVMLVLIIPVHELGHAVAAVAVGFRVANIVIGTGPSLGTFTFLGVNVQINLLPLGGLTSALPLRPYPSMRWRQWILTAGGPAANVLIYFGLRRIFGSAVDDPDHHPIVAAAKSVNWTILVMNLIPFRTSEGASSDGYGLFTIPFWSADRVAATNLMLQGSLLHRQRQNDAAGVAWRQALALATEPRQVAMLKNNIAWLQILDGRAENLAEADRLSADAITALPGNAALCGTRGAVLLRLGRAGEALPLLVAAEAAAIDARNRAFDRALMASALAALGSRGEALASLAEARRLDPACELIPHAEADVAAAPLGPPVAASSAHGAAAAAPATSPIIENAAALRRWRRDLRILAFACVPVMAQWLGIDLVLSVTAIVMSLAPELAGAYTLAGLGLSSSLLHAIGLAGSPPFVTVAPGRAQAALIALAIGAVAVWLIARHRRIGPPPRSRTPAVLGWILFSLLLLQVLPAAFIVVFDHSPLFLHGVARAGLWAVPGLIGFATLLASRARPLVRRLAVVPVIIAVTALVPGSTWYLNRFALAGVPTDGPELTIADPVPAKVVRSAQVAHGDAPSLSPGGRAFVLEEFEAHTPGDKQKPRFVLHVGDFEGHLVDIEGTTGAFIDDERLIILRPRVDPDGPDLMSEVRPFRSPQPIWTKPIPHRAMRDTNIRIDRAGSTIFIVPTETGRDDAPLGWWTTAEPDTLVEPDPLRQRAGDRLVAVVPRVGDGGGALVWRGKSPASDLFWRTSRDDLRLLSNWVRVDCADPLPGAAQLWCFTARIPILLRIDLDEPRVTRVPGEIEGWEPRMLGRSTLATIRGDEIQILDLKSGRGARLTLPESAHRSSTDFVAGGLATIERGDRRDDPATLTVYEMPAGFH